MSDHQHLATPVAASRIEHGCSQKVAVTQASFIFLAAILENMLTLPFGTEAGIQLPCILNLTTRRTIESQSGRNQ
jgi:hypothetical protein